MISFLADNKLCPQKKLATKRRLATSAFLLWAALSSTFQNISAFPKSCEFAVSRRGSHGNLHRMIQHGVFLQPSMPLVLRKSVSMRAGRERRIPSSASSNQKQQQKINQQEQYTQEQRKLIEKEELARLKRLHQMEQRLRKAARREDRIFILETKLAREQQGATSDDTSEKDIKTDATPMTEAEMAELEGLLRGQDNFEEQYDPWAFSEEHIEFKALHNDVFARLVRWCEHEQEIDSAKNQATNVFFLDGPDGGTASSLIRRGNFAPCQCYVANRHESTCVALRESGGGLLPDSNIVHATSSEALTKGAAPGVTQGDLAHLDFTGYYFDGCGGYAPHIVNMMSSALLILQDDDGDAVEGDEDKKGSHPPIVVGYSLLGGTKNLVEKELEVSRALTIIARSRGMRVFHALDDPSRFGLPPNVPKLGGNEGKTFTTWLILQAE